MKCKAALFTDQPEKIKATFGHGRYAQLTDLCDVHPRIVTSENIESELALLTDVEVIVSSWGMLKLTEAQLDRLPRLKALFYAAGATEYFAAPLHQRDITLVSAWRANAVPVAEFCLAQILLACKGYFANTRTYNGPDDFASLSLNAVAPGIYGETIALLGAGAISQHLQSLLQPFTLEVLTIPSRPEQRTMTFEQAFEQAFVISNHLPNRADNVGVLDGQLFQRMRPGAVFINTGRGLQVNEKELAEVFAARPDLTALLDVTKPEPPEVASALYALPNVQLTAHIAGSMHDETLRLADCVIAELSRWLKGEPLCHQVNPPQ